jgi:NAD(P)-dependent dehydrogenase (short-subunit alcohol dehydrogenase family)
VGDGIGLTVNAVTPGFIATDMPSTVPDKLLERIRGQIPVGRLGRPDLGGQRRPGDVSGGIVNHQRDVVVLAAVPTGIGKYGGGLASVPPWHSTPAHPALRRWSML